MSAIERRLEVFFREALAGDLSLDRRDRLVFQYSRDYKGPALSFSLPLREEPFAPEEARPFFSNLLPEGDVRKVIAKIEHISEQNDYKLLERLGGDCAGALSLWRPGTRPEAVPHYRMLSDPEFRAILRDRMKAPPLLFSGKARLSLAGAQQKLPVFIGVDGQIQLPEGGAPSSHIVKFAIPGYEDSIENEYFSLQAARLLGLPVPDATVREFGEDGRVLVLSRYDRATKAEGLIRLHQEDFCQSLGVAPDHKYQNEGGPGFKQCFDLVRGVSSDPLADVSFLLDWAIFNVLIGNADAHAKNLSLLLLEGDQRWRLAPLYDLLSTAVYPSLNVKNAMKLGTEYETADFRAKDWNLFAEHAGLSEKLVKDRLAKIATALPPIVSELQQKFDTEYGEIRTIRKSTAMVQQRAKRFEKLES